MAEQGAMSAFFFRIHMGKALVEIISFLHLMISL
jgi:hypothetical protein